MGSMPSLGAMGSMGSMPSLGAMGSMAYKYMLTRPPLRIDLVRILLLMSIVLSNTSIGIYWNMLGDKGYMADQLSIIDTRDDLEEQIEAAAERLGQFAAASLGG
jgi:hypothetical protein